MNGGGAGEVRELLKAVGRLASPGDVLFGEAHAARETFDLLDYANKMLARDGLAARLEVALKDWQVEIGTLVVH